MSDLEKVYLTEYISASKMVSKQRVHDGRSTPKFAMNRQLLRLIGLYKVLSSPEVLEMFIHNFPSPVNQYNEICF